MIRYREVPLMFSQRNRKYCLELKRYTYGQWIFVFTLWCPFWMRYTRRFDDMLRTVFVSTVLTRHIVMDLRLSDGRVNLIIQSKTLFYTLAIYWPDQESFKNTVQTDVLLFDQNSYIFIISILKRILHIIHIVLYIIII